MIREMKVSNTQVVLVVPAPDQMMTPYHLGQMDAEDDELCLPELYYVKAQDKYDYALGYNEIRPSILAQQVMEQFENAQHEAAQLERDEVYVNYEWR